MTTRLSGRVMVTALLCAAAVLALAGSAEQAYFPAGSRLSTVAKFKLIGPEALTTKSRAASGITVFSDPRR